MSKFRIVGAMLRGSSPDTSVPPSNIAILIQSLSSMVHFNNEWLGVPYLAKHPVIQLLSPRHLAVQVNPLRQDGSSRRHALAWSAHLSTKQSLSSNEASRPLSENSSDVSERKKGGPLVDQLKRDSPIVSVDEGVYVG